jgi:hypothetical protein
MVQGGLAWVRGNSINACEILFLMTDRRQTVETPRDRKTGTAEIGKVCIKIVRWKSSSDLVADGQRDYNLEVR